MASPDITIHLKSNEVEQIATALEAWDYEHNVDPDKDELLALFKAMSFKL